MSLLLALTGGGVASHDASGNLAAGSAGIVGAAAHPHTTTGELVAAVATISGAAEYTNSPHATTGTLQAGASAVSGSAERSGANSLLQPKYYANLRFKPVQREPAPYVEPEREPEEPPAPLPVVHVARGALEAGHATVTSTTRRKRFHTASGALVASPAATSSGSAHPSLSSGILVATSASIRGRSKRTLMRDRLTRIEKVIGRMRSKSAAQAARHLKKMNQERAEKIAMRLLLELEED